MSSTWRTAAMRIAVVLLIAAALTVVAVLIVSVVSRNSPCKNSSTCPVYQTCSSKGICVSLPGYKCTRSDQCSIYAPICSKGYCTNFANQPRGTSGNPPTEGNGLKCQEGLVLNPIANLCQEPVIGAQCTMDAQCNVGLCNQSAKTCQYASKCTTDIVRNPVQCMPPYECDPGSLQCSTSGATPGSDGTPCNSNSDCGTGSSCIYGPPGSGFSGVCRSGQLTWLTIIGDSSSASGKCMTPLQGGSTGWCRYDIENFMKCTSIGQCQYPYASCDTNLQLCRPEESDPINPANFNYTPVGVNSGSIDVKGAFYAATYPVTPPAVNNTTGGKLIDQYTGFLSSGRFQDQPAFAGRELVTFSLLTSFCVVSMAVAAEPAIPPQIPYYGSIFEDPNPMIVMSSIVRYSADLNNSLLLFSFYSQNFTIPNLDPQLNIWIGRIFFPTAGARMWNPSAIADPIIGNPALAPVSFVPNPIVNPWINITLPTMVPHTQTSMVHSLFYANGRYCLGLLFGIIGFKSNNFQRTAIFSPAIVQADGTIRSLTSDVLLITSWDAMTTWISGSATYTTTLLFYGLFSGTYVLFTAQLQLAENGVDRITLVGQPTAAAPDQFVIQSQQLPFDITTPATQFRLSRSLQQVAEPLLLVTIFSETVTGLQLLTYSVSSMNASFDPTGAGCKASQVLRGVSSLRYVTSLTGAYNYGAFVVWCSTGETRSAFLLVQINASCNNGNLSFQPIYTAVYWRRLTSDPVDDYYLYPVGGASLPFFLATDIPLTFDGIPVLPPV